MNKFIAIGRTTSDIELKISQTGKSIVNFSIAVKRSYKNAAGEYESDFINCAAFGKTAERINKYVRTGNLVGIEGSLQVQKYTDKEGNNRSFTSVVVENIEFLQAKKEEQTTGEVKQEEFDPFAKLPFEEAEFPFEEAELPY